MTSSGQGRLVFAFGDIHGRADLLEAALPAVQAYAGGRAAKLVFLGDYVDRGPESRAVIERLMRLDADPAVVCLKGNHEALMVDALTRPSGRRLELWLDQGGTQTLASYGASTIEEGKARVPASHLRWMAGLPLTSGDGDRIYVHAGLAPGTPLADQDEDTCLWIRERFLRADPGGFEGHIVHGHSTRWEGKPDDARPEHLPHRTNLDTGAYRTGVLSVGVFEEGVPGGAIAVISVAADGIGNIVTRVATCLQDAGPPAARARGRGWLHRVTRLLPGV